MQPTGTRPIATTMTRSENDIWKPAARIGDESGKPMLPARAGAGALAR